VRIERKVGTIIAVLGSLLLAVSGAVPALAGNGPTAGFAHITGMRFAGTANTTSTSFGGWVFGAKAAKSVTAEFKVPTLKCTSTTSGILPLAALQSGSATAPKTSAGGVLLVCQGGSPAVAATVIVNNKQINDTTNALHAGDLMKATVTISATKTTATIADLTVGHTFKFTKSGTGGTAIDEAIIDSSLVNTSNQQLPVVNFGKISYSKGAVGGKAIGTVSPRTAVNMQTSSHVLQILTGTITGTAKNAFTTTFKHA
jgi:hypothetical protein